MIKDIYYADQGDKDIEVMIPLILKIASDRFGDEQTQNLRWHLYYLLSDQTISRTVLRHMEKQHPVGFCLFSENRILFIYMSYDISDRKIASYILMNAVISKILSSSPPFIVADCAQSVGSMIDDEIMQNLSFHDFFDVLNVRLSRETKLPVYHDKPDAQALSHLSFYSYINDEHRDAVVDFLCSHPDVFVEKLFAGSGKKLTYRRDYYNQFLFRDVVGKSISFSPDFSTVVFTPDNHCIGVLLCTETGEIKVVNAFTSQKASRFDIISELLSRTLFNVKPQYRKTEAGNSVNTVSNKNGNEGFDETVIEKQTDGRIGKLFISLPADDGKLIQWIKKAGFQETGEFRNWGLQSPFYSG